MVRHPTLDIEDVSGEFLSHLLEKQLSFSREATSLKQGGNKEFFLESKTTLLRRLLEMHQVFSQCSPSGGSQEKTGTTWKRSGQLLGSHEILRRPEMKYKKDLVQQSWMGSLQNLWHSQ